MVGTGLGKSWFLRQACEIFADISPLSNFVNAFVDSGVGNGWLDLPRSVFPAPGWSTSSCATLPHQMGECTVAQVDASLLIELARTLICRFPTGGRFWKERLSVKDWGFCRHRLGCLFRGRLPNLQILCDFVIYLSADTHAIAIGADRYVLSSFRSIIGLFHKFLCSGKRVVANSECNVSNSVLLTFP